MPHEPPCWVAREVKEPNEFLDVQHRAIAQLDAVTVSKHTPLEPLCWDERASADNHLVVRVECNDNMNASRQ